MSRYQVEFDGYGYLITDTTIEDGDNCLVGGNLNRQKAEELCADLNREVEEYAKDYEADRRFEEARAEAVLRGAK